jgi:hypothetical protein
MAGFLSPRLKIKFEPGEGPDNLTIIGPDGERFLSYTELVKQRDADRERAEEQTRRAEEQTRRAEEQTRRAEEQTRRAEEEARRAAEHAQRADRLAAQLRQLGIEPE